MTAPGGLFLPERLNIRGILGPAGGPLAGNEIIAAHEKDSGVGVLMLVEQLEQFNAMCSSQGCIGQVWRDPAGTTGAFVVTPPGVSYGV